MIQEPGKGERQQASSQWEFQVPLRCVRKEVLGQVDLSHSLILKKRDFRFQDSALNVNPCLVDALQSDENWESLPTPASGYKDLTLGSGADISGPGTQLHSFQQFPPNLPSLSFPTSKNANVFSPSDECLAPTENSHH